MKLLNRLWSKVFVWNSDNLPSVIEHYRKNEVTGATFLHYKESKEKTVGKIYKLNGVIYKYQPDGSVDGIQPIEIKCSDESLLHTMFDSIKQRFPASRLTIAQTETTIQRKYS
jgi:hypothetical protein